LRHGDEACSSHFELLLLFAYGTMTDYEANKSAFPPLTQAQSHKLILLTALSFIRSSKQSFIPFSTLEENLPGPVLDLLIELIYSECLKGKLDAEQAALHIEYVMARDVPLEPRPGVLGLDDLILAFEDWDKKCTLIRREVHAQMARITSTHEEALNAASDHARLKDEEIEKFRAFKERQQQQNAQAGDAMDVDKVQKSTRKRKGRLRENKVN